MRERVKILFIEENSSYFELLESCADMGHSDVSVECLRARSESEALSILPSAMPDLLVIDLYLSDGLSLDFLGRKELGYLPVVVIGPSPRKDLADLAGKSGALAYFSRSEDPDEIERLLAHLSTLALEHRPSESGRCH